MRTGTFLPSSGSIEAKRADHATGRVIAPSAAVFQQPVQRRRRDRCRLPDSQREDRSTRLLDVPEVSIVSREHDEPLPAPHLGNLVEIRQQLPVVHRTSRWTPARVRPQVLDLDREVIWLAYPKVDTGSVAASRTLEDDVLPAQAPMPPAGPGPGRNGPRASLTQISLICAPGRTDTSNEENNAYRRFAFALRWRCVTAGCLGSAAAGSSVRRLRSSGRSFSSWCSC